MKGAVLVLCGISALLGIAQAFIPNAGLGLSPVRTCTPLRMGYVPEGLTPEQWKKIQEKDKAKGNLGEMGPKRFKSRSFAAWQAAGGKVLFVRSYFSRCFLNHFDKTEPKTNFCALVLYPAAFISSRPKKSQNR